MATPFSPSVAGAGLELQGQDWIDYVVTPLQADSVVMSIEGVVMHSTDVPLHIPIMSEAVVDETVWAAPNAPVAEFEGVTSELVLMGRGLKACKILAKISSESFRSTDALGASQTMLVNQIRKIVDKALIQGDATAGITGLIPAATNVIKHSRFVLDGVLASSTAVSSATAAFTSADVGSTISGAGIPAGATIVTVTDASHVVISAAATATGSGVTLTIAVPTLIYDHLVDALTMASDAYARPTHWVINTQTIGVLRKLKDTLGRPLLSPDTTVQGADAILGRTVIPAPSAALPHGCALLLDPTTIHVAVDLIGYMKIALEAFISTDSIGLLVASRFDIGCTIPAGLVVVEGMGPN
jgi:hypothetical protein